MIYTYMDAVLTNAITAIEDYCRKNRISHRFVGGVSYGGLVSETTTYRINASQKTIELFGHNPLSLVRTDGTIRDIDVILFCPKRKSMQNLRNYITTLEKKAAKEHIPFPVIAMENAIYEPEIRNTTAQFVTAIEVTKQNDVYLTFDDITQKICWQSLEPWTVILEDNTKFTTRNPIADYCAYHIRAPGGIKPKDQEKLKWLKKLSEAVTQEGKMLVPPVDYGSEVYFSSWREYMRKLDGTTHARIRLKKWLLSLYWKTIGTTFAHGKGFLRYLLVFSNQFTGVKQ